uniref:Uncharacterized protein n=1 Tax=Arundo donax TaxID=35708 RepID=A0A0A9GV46_ARUDO
MDQDFKEWLSSRDKKILRGL